MKYNKGTRHEQVQRARAADGFQPESEWIRQHNTADPTVLFWAW